MRYAVLILLLEACSRSTPNDTADSGDDTGAACVAEIAADPTSIAFGDVDGGDVDAQASATVTVSNPGCDALQIREVSLADASAPFSVSGITSVLIAPGSDATFTVTFAPATPGDFATSILVESSAGDLAVPVSGNGTGGVLAMTSASLDFGTVSVGCTGAQTVTLTNTGNGDLVLDDTAFVPSGLGFTLEDLPWGPPPWTLGPEDRVRLILEWAPVAEGPVEAELIVSSTDPRPNAGTIALTGIAGPAAITTEVFVVADEPPMDIVVAYDATSEPQTAGALATLVDALHASDLDFQLTALTSDDGCAAGPWIDPATADPGAALAVLIEGATASGIGFTRVEAALAATGADGCNEGLVRADAQLALVGVTDATEQSPNPWTYYVSAFQALKLDPDDVVFHAAAGDYPTGCGDADPGVGWYEASVATGGEYLSICATDWAASLAERLIGPAPQTAFELAGFPLADTLVVTVDGEVRTSGWVYNETDGTIAFDAAPAPGSIVEVSYAVTACE